MDGVRYRGLSRRRYTKPAVDPAETKTLVARIEKVALRGVSTLTDWERNFLSSLLDNAKKWGRLTAKQHEIFQRVEKKTDPSHVKAVNDWRSNYTKEMQEKAVFAANYYKANPPYFGDAANRILCDSEYIPSEKLYRKMVENRYVQRAMENAQAAPLYAVGSLAQVREGLNVRGHASRHLGKMVVIINVSDNNLSATKGARKYTVLPVGAAKPFTTEERYLKRAKKNKK
jgi:hypothetical protein